LRGQAADHPYPDHILCTVISESYGTEERRDVADALEELLTPGSPDWSRRGVYVYWDRESHEILYLGLANDLPTRFQQHNGLVSHGGGNKTQEINDYFEMKPYLGFTIVVQGAAVALHDTMVELDFTLGVRSHELIAVGEGQLIETHRLVHGKRPPWNKTGGARQGRRMATPSPSLLDLLAARRSSLFMARRSLRAIAGDRDAQSYEAAIHASRMRATMDAHHVARFPENQERLMSAITRITMLSAGHLLDELDASDEVIVDWLLKLGNPDHWREEAAKARRMVEIARGRPLRDNERQVGAMLDAIFAQAAPPEHISATEAIFENDYLDETPELAA
jgi:hypothetical protein